MKYRINAVIVLFALIAALLTGCNLNKNSPQDSVVSDKNYPVTLNGITLNSAPSKVVVLSPSLAEIIVDMGFVSSLAGRAEECDQPASVAALPVVGSVLIPNIDAIYKLKPDLILVQKEPSQIIQNMFSDKKIPFVVIPAAKNYAELLAVYQTVGKVFVGSELGLTRGKEQMTAINAGLEGISDKVSAVPSENPINVIYVTDSLGHAATGDTVLHRLITTTSAINLAGDSKDWSAPAASLSGVEVIFCPQQLVDKVKGMPGFSGSPAVKNKRVYGLDASAMERQSQRMIDAVQEMAEVLYPDLFKEDITTSSTTPTTSTTTPGKI
ncbi:MAG: ABC transporter substrate-binding protein [Oscillospiraceae bacterium]|nr:ABC transporter substrate-binding protein [Oscillospiraceae bacterium]MDD3832928.1 ABC transporter substrate-binding protein [Oscillospiraceae bacterium]MDD4546123.1 ABC transporter substrate-binding protein [Oscillospiraceae bacterium]